MFHVELNKKTMATKKKGQLNTASEYAKHLRKFGKKLFWKGERSEEKKKLKKL